MTWLPDDQRVVVTGIGAITPVGLDFPTAWANVRNGQSGAGRITLFDTTDYAVKIAGEAWGFDPLNYMPARDARRADRTTQFALAAAEEAFQQANLTITPSNTYDIGVMIGSGAGGISTYIKEYDALKARGPRGVSPLLIPLIVVDSASVQISIRYGARGPNLGMASACSTSLDAVGMALEVIRRGDADVMITGGAEAAVNVLGITGFDQLRALSHRNDDPPAASRPFDADRDGFLLSEGSVVLILERLTHARARDAEILGEIRAYAATADAQHFTAPDDTGSGAAESIRRALKKARLTPADLGYINAHATSTPLGDSTEGAALRAALGQHATRIPISSTKSTTGHMLGAAGALATGLTMQALRSGCLPPTINLHTVDPAVADLNHIAHTACPTDAQFAIVNSYGFGGHNSCLVLQRWSE